mgnify:CR=1 FL=1
MGMGLRPQAMPTARGPDPSAIAMPPYVAVPPKGISHIIFQTLFWKSVPRAASGRSKRLSFPAK